MRLLVSDLDIHTGGPLIAILHQKDAEELDIHYGDRIEIRHNNHHAVAVADITHHKNTVRPGRIGLMEELMSKLAVKHGSMVRIAQIPKPLSTRIIKKKMDGGTLSYHEMLTVVREIVRNEITEAELAAFVTACYAHELTNNEVVSLCRAMVETGERLRFSRKPVLDVHCIGGVPNNRTTMIIVPIVAAAGLLIPKTSSRAITSPSGTADTLETLTNVSIDVTRLTRIMKKVDGCMVWGGALNLAPADDKIIRVEHPLNIDAEGQMIASVMAKKYAVGSTHVLLDIPIGKTTKIKDEAAGRRLRSRFEYAGRALGIRMKIIFTDGNEPIGDGVGPALEALDVLKVLKNKKDANVALREKSLMMAGLMFEMAEAAGKGQGYANAKRILESGMAWKKFQEIVAAQGKAPRSRLKLGHSRRILRAQRSGVVAQIDSSMVSKVAKEAGAPKAYGAGVYLHHHVSDEVKRGDALMTIYAANRTKLSQALAVLGRGKVFIIR